MSNTNKHTHKCKHTNSSRNANIVIVDLISSNVNILMVVLRSGNVDFLMVEWTLVNAYILMVELSMQASVDHYSPDSTFAAELSCLNWVFGATLMTESCCS